MSSVKNPGTSVFALALLGIDGVGPVAVNRILSHFGSYDDLLAFPREQLLTRLKGLQRVATWLEIVTDRHAFEPYLEKASAYAQTLGEKQIKLLSRYHPSWPLESMEDEHLPPVLYFYGSESSLRYPSIGFIGSPPLEDSAFELAQTLCHQLSSNQTTMYVGDETGFDVVIAKIGSAAEVVSKVVMVHHTGLAKLSSEVRPIASQVSRSGGGLLSGFEMMHGPFAHDKKIRTLLIRACSSVCIFLPSSDSTVPSVRDVPAGKPTFVLGRHSDDLPDHIHTIENEVDLDWISLAMKTNL